MKGGDVQAESSPVGAPAQQGRPAELAAARRPRRRCGARGGAAAALEA